MTKSFHTLETAEGGYTLIEMLVVVAIIAAVSALAIPNLMQPSDGWRLRTAARALVEALRLTRTTAIVRNMPMVLQIDVDQRSFQSPAVSRQTLPSDLTVQLKVAEPERTTQSTGGFRFFPDGSSTGGDLTLTLHDQRAAICVHWLTGESRVAGSC